MGIRGFPKRRMRVFQAGLLCMLGLASRQAWTDEARQGAGLHKHWAFEAVPDIDPPAVRDREGWARTAIDSFVLRRLQTEGLEPSPPSDRERWLRRVTLDLTGVPPTIPEMDSFLDDRSADAHEKTLDRLLASPAYGERMTLQWLDSARYADTHGYDNDGLNRMWPWRDWAIRAFNQNLPYDEFVRWQVAGDLLPTPTQDQLLATAFNRLHRQNAEGGALAEEFVVEYVVDRVQTFGNAFLGLSLECARCHDHKFDPISQRDFYALYALFGNIDEVGLYPEWTGATPTPNMFLYESGQEEKHARLERAVEDAAADLRAAGERARGRFDLWQAPRRRSLAALTPLLHLSFDAPLESPEQLASPEQQDKAPSYEVPASASLVSGQVGKAVRFSGDHGIELEETRAFERTDPFTMAAWLRPAGGAGRTVVWHNSMPAWQAGGRGYEFALNDGHVEFSLTHAWPGNAIRVRTREPLQPERWTHVAVTYDGSSRAAGIHVYFDTRVVAPDVVRDNLYGTIVFSRKKIPPLVLGARESEAGFKNGELDEFTLFGHCLTRLELARLVHGPAAAELEARVGSGQALLTYYLERVDEVYAQARRKLDKARQAESDFANSLRTIMVMREKSTPARAFVLHRGAYDQPGAEIGPGVPRAILPPVPGRPRDRLDLAEWLVRRDHPLTSRVAVNRIWQIFFGRGLVETPDDFGSQGGPPSHPELLDYLAARFMESGWDVKALCRWITTSATYRQDSTPRGKLAARDPQNILLARGPRHRLCAEQIRDSALAACSLLTDRIGGPSVKPYQPDGLWREVGPMKFQADAGEDLYRKSMYTFWKRTVPPPTMLSFDAVSREVCVSRRDTTVTPAQALALLNDPQFVEAARVLAASVLKRHGRDTAPAIEEVFRRLTGRRPRDTERSGLLQGHEEQRRFFAAAADDARAYVSVGEWRPDASLDVVDVAAMTSVVQLVMSFYEFQVKS